MERKAPNFILILDALILAVVLGVLFLMRPEQPEVLEITAATETSTVPEETTATTETTPETTQTEPPEQRYTISFAGDCTLGNGRGDYGSAGSFMAVVGEDYDYPFANVVDIFSADDLTLVNFEGTLTNSTGAVDKDFNFHGPPEYAQILTAGSIEWVNLSNNHSYDYGWTGYTDTRNALDGAGIAYAGSDETSLLTLEGGLTVGIYANRFNASAAELKAGITSLKTRVRISSSYPCTGARSAGIPLPTTRPTAVVWPSTTALMWSSVTTPMSCSLSRNTRGVTFFTVWPISPSAATSIPPIRILPSSSWRSSRPGRARYLWEN